MTDHIDTADADALDAMRAQLQSQVTTPEAQNLMAGLSDAEVLNAMDCSYEGGAAAFVQDGGWQ